MIQHGDTHKQFQFVNSRYLSRSFLQQVLHSHLRQQNFTLKIIFDDSS